MWKGGKQKRPYSSWHILPCNGLFQVLLLSKRSFWFFLKTSFVHFKLILANRGSYQHGWLSDHQIDFFDGKSFMFSLMDRCCSGSHKLSLSQRNRQNRPTQAKRAPFDSRCQMLCIENIDYLQRKDKKRTLASSFTSQFPFVFLRILTRSVMLENSLGLPLLEEFLPSLIYPTGKKLSRESKQSISRRKSSLDTYLYNLI